MARKQNSQPATASDLQKFEIPADAETQTAVADKELDIAYRPPIHELTNDEMRDMARENLFQKAMTAIEQAIWCGRPGVCIKIDSYGMPESTMSGAGKALYERLHKWAVAKGIMCFEMSGRVRAVDSESRREEFQYAVVVAWDDRENLPNPVVPDSGE
jgi:hypothetical protein